VDAPDVNRNLRLGFGIILVWVAPTIVLLAFELANGGDLTWKLVLGHGVGNVPVALLFWLLIQRPAMSGRYIGPLVTGLTSFICFLLARILLGKSLSSVWLLGLVGGGLTLAVLAWLVVRLPGWLHGRATQSQSQLGGHNHRG
jgi:hypothetical protein